MSGETSLIRLVFPEAAVEELNCKVKEKADSLEDPGPVDPKVASYSVNTFISTLLDESVPHKDLLGKSTGLPGTTSNKQPMMGEDRQDIYSITRAAWSIVPEYQGVDGLRRLDAVIYKAIRVKLNNFRLNGKIVKKEIVPS